MSSSLIFNGFLKHLFEVVLWGYYLFLVIRVILLFLLGLSLFFFGELLIDELRQFFHRLYLHFINVYDVMLIV